VIDGRRRQISEGPFARKVDAEAWLRNELKLAREGPGDRAEEDHDSRAA
jgi:hypothetical protein